MQSKIFRSLLRLIDCWKTYVYFIRLWTILQNTIFPKMQDLLFYILSIWIISHIELPSTISLECLYGCSILLVSFHWKLGCPSTFPWGWIAIRRRTTQNGFYPKYVCTPIIFISCNVNENIWKELSVVDDVWNLSRPRKLNEESGPQLFNEK